MSAGAYTFSSSISSDYITITNVNNVVIEHGYQPLSMVIHDTGTYRMHISADSTCTSNASCRETSVVFVLGVPPLNFNAVAPINSLSTYNFSGFNAGSAHIFYRNAYIVPKHEFQTANLQVGSFVNSLGFDIWQNPWLDTVVAAVNIYLENSKDTNYQKDSLWNSVISTMNLVYTDTVEFVSAQGRKDLVYLLDAVFEYTGDGVYVATDWEILGTPPSSSLGITYYVNTDLPNSIAYDFSPGSPPASLTRTSNSRPETRWGVDILADDFEVTKVFTLGTNMLNYGYPETMEVHVRNNGYLPANKPVTLNVTGANTYTSTQNVQLAHLEDTVLVFNGFNPVNLGYNTITASVPPDMHSGNNSDQSIQLTTPNRMGHAGSSRANIQSLGASNGNMFVNKHFVHGTLEVTDVKVPLSTDSINISVPVYGVVIDSSENIIGLTDTLIISSSDLGTTVMLSFITPPVLTDEAFYIGAAQVPNATPPYYSPFTMKRLRPQRSDVYYLRSLLDSSLVPTSNQISFIAEAVLGNPDCPTPTSLQAENFCDSIVVSWNSSTQTLTSNLEYGPIGFFPGSGTIVSNVQSPYVLRGMTPGSYDILVYDSCASSASFISNTATAQADAPVADFTSTFIGVAHLTFNANASIGGDSFDWDFGDGNTGTGSIITHTYTANGTYDVMLVVSKDCESDTIVKPVEIFGLSSTTNEMANVNIYPNPSRGVFHIDNLPDAHGTLIVTNVQGAIVYSEEGFLNTIDMSSMADGVYFFTISGEYGKLHRKVVVAKD